MQSIIIYFAWCKLSFTLQMIYIIQTFYISNMLNLINYLDSMEFYYNDVKVDNG